MEPYNFWQDFFDTYQSLSDWLKTLWLIVPPVFILGLVWLWRRHTTPPATLEADEQGRLPFSRYRDSNGQIRIVSDVAPSSDQPGFLQLNPSDLDRSGGNGALAIETRHKDEPEGTECRGPAGNANRQHTALPALEPVRAPSECRLTPYAGQRLPPLKRGGGAIPGNAASATRFDGFGQVCQPSAARKNLPNPSKPAAPVKWNFRTAQRLPQSLHLSALM